MSDIEIQATSRRLERLKKRRRHRHRPSPRGTVLISHLAPNRPDVVQEASQIALNSASQSKAEDEDDEGRQDKDMNMLQNPMHQTEHVQSTPDLAKEALQVVEENKDVDIAEAQPPHSDE